MPVHTDLMQSPGPSPSSAAWLPRDVVLPPAVWRKCVCVCGGGGGAAGAAAGPAGGSWWWVSCRLAGYVRACVPGGRGGGAPPGVLEALPRWTQPLILHCACPSPCPSPYPARFAPGDLVQQHRLQAAGALRVQRHLAGGRRRPASTAHPGVRAARAGRGLWRGPPHDDAGGHVAGRSRVLSADVCCAPDGHHLLHWAAKAATARSGNQAIRQPGQLWDCAWCMDACGSCEVLEQDNIADLGGWSATCRVGFSPADAPTGIAF
jgi:hypothetical protein